MAAARTGLRAWLGKREDDAGLVLFRVLFGLLAAGAALRFVAKGWVEALLGAPPVHLPWVRGLETPSNTMLYLLFAAQVLGGLLVATGRATRAGLGLWLAAFVYVELLDKTLYLNHYVFLTLVGATLLTLPWGPGGRFAGGAPRWARALLQLEVGLVWLWAGLAKLNADWLLRGWPLAAWLPRHGDLPLIGPLLEAPATALAMSWAGAAYDLLIPALLLWPRSRAMGLALVLAFHAAVGLLFPIGVFPWVMIASATLFLRPDWPRRLAAHLGQLRPAPALDHAAPLSAPATAALLGIAALLSLWPGRHLLLGWDAAWAERGHRFAWRVMLIEKGGMVELRVVDKATGTVRVERPRDQLRPWQEAQVRTQPDLIRDYALLLADQAKLGGAEVAVYADAWASLNGRPAQRLLRPDLDLTRPEAELWAEGWVLPLGGRWPGDPD